MARLHELDERAQAARDMAADPRIDVTCLESVIGTRYTVDTINYLRRRASGLRFVWIMGADNLAQFHRWQHWQRIATQVPIAVIDRPPQSFRALAAPAAQALAPYRLPENEAGRLADQRAAGLGVPHRAENESFVDDLAEPGWELEDRDVKSDVGYWILKPLTPHA